MPRPNLNTVQISRLPRRTPGCPAGRSQARIAACGGARFTGRGPYLNRIGPNLRCTRRCPAGRAAAGGGGGVGSAGELFVRRQRLGRSVARASVMIETDEKPELHFFRRTPDDLISRPPLGSSLQNLESSFFLIALGRFP